MPRFHSSTVKRYMDHSTSKTRIAVRMLALLLCAPLAAQAADYQQRIEKILSRTPLIDGHNDLPWEIRDRFHSDFGAVDLRSDTRRLPPPPDGVPLMTDIPRMRAGHMGGQFWSVWIPSAMKGPETVQTTLEQIDLVKRMAA